MSGEKKRSTDAADVQLFSLCLSGMFGQQITVLVSLL
jgi:hypothetical protein